MQQPVTYCDCCGLPISPQSGVDCPRCGYPIIADKEERFLTSALGDLQRVANHGGANLTVAGLMRRYRMRLNYLHQAKAGFMPAIPPAFSQPMPSEVVSSTPPAPSIPAQAQPPLPPVAPIHQPTPPRTPRSEIIPVNPPIAPLALIPPATPPVQERETPPRPAFSFSLRSFVVDQAITIIGLLGAFLILIGALSSVVTTTNPLQSFLIVFGVHAFFGIGGAVALRFPNSRLIARIYTGIYTLLVPLVGFTGYSLIQGNIIHLSVPTLITIAAIYAAIVYFLLAIYQRFSLFGYLGAMALVVADLAIARNLNQGYWWWPSMLMLLALPALVSLSTRWQVFTGALSELRDPVRILMYTIIGICVLGILFTTLYSISPEYFALPGKELRFSILLMSVLLLLWTSLFLWLTKNTRALLVLAYILLACVLAFCYAFDFSALGYALALTCVALFYHGLNRFAGRLLQPFGLLGLGLDQLALILVSIVPFLSSPLLPQQLLFNAYHISVLATSPLYIQTLWNWNTISELIAVIAGLTLTFSVTLARANQSEGTHTQGNYWPWLLLLSGFLLNWAYSIVILVSQVEPVWCFLGLTLLVLALTVLVRQRFGASWANPLDVLALAEILLTLSLSLSQNAQSISSLLLLFAALSYAVILYQRRQNLLFLPFTFAVLALPALLSVGPYTVPLLLGVLLPFASVAIHQLMPNKTELQGTQSPAGSAGISLSGGQVIHEDPLFVWMRMSMVKFATIWEWPLLAIGLLYGIVVCLLDMITPESTVHNWLGITFPVALEMATISLAWYGATALVRIKWWLIPVLGFAIAAVLLPTNSFWVLLWVVPVAAVLALAISRFAGKIWASPLYTVALLGVVMTGYTGYYQDHWSATTWALLAFALLAYFIGVIEDLNVSLWLAPVLATWSVYDSATLLGDLYRPPTIALICATFGVAIGLLRLSLLPVPGLMRSNRFLRYSLPFYTTALASAVLTGIYGVLAGVNYPFFAAIPDALLLYAAVAFGVVFFERRPEWLGLVAAFGIWAALMTTHTRAPYVAGIALGASLVGLLAGRYIKQSVTPTQSQTALQTFTKFTWGWPWYLIALVAAMVTGIWPVLSPFPLPGGFNFIEYSLLAFAVLAYIIGFVEDMLPWLWIAPIFATWSLIDAAAQGNFRRLFIIALVCVILGVTTSCLKFIPRLLPARPGKTLLGYAMPFYTTALVAAGLTGIDGTLSNTDHLFYFVALLLYAALCYAVLLFERQPKWLALVAGFAVWATVLATQITAYHVAALALGLSIVGLLAGPIIRRFVMNRETPVFLTSIDQFTWNWPWYLTALVAAMLTGLWPSSPLAQPATGFIGYSLLAITALSLVIMLVERTPELLLFPVGLAALTIWQWQPHLDLPSLMIAYSLLSILIFASQFVWTLLPPSLKWLPPTMLHRILALGTQTLIVLIICGNGGLSADSLLSILIFASQFVWTLLPPSLKWLPPTMLHRILALGTQTLIVLIICGNGGLSADSGMLAFVGAGSLFVLAFLLFWYGRLQQNVTLQRYCDYTAGLLLSLVIPWTLSAFRQTNLNLLMLAPATYLTIIAPILMRDDSLPQHQQLGQVVALSGTALLLLPTLWLSFTNSDANLLYTMILLGESILLLLLGIGLGMRVFVLSGAGLIVVGTLHALFLPTLGIPTPLALTILGGTLLAVATALSLVRRRLQAAWIHWE